MEVLRAVPDSQLAQKQEPRGGGGASAGAGPIQRVWGWRRRGLSCAGTAQAWKEHLASIPRCGHRPRHLPLHRLHHHRRCALDGRACAYGGRTFDGEPPGCSCAQRRWGKGLDLRQCERTGERALELSREREAAGAAAAATGQGGG